MSDKKLTDNEIIQALTYCVDDTDDICQQCPLKEECYANVGGTENIKQLALDLINRLTTERNNLAHNNATLVRESITMQDLMKNQKAKTYKEVLDIIDQVYNKHIFGYNDLEAEEKDAIINFSDDITSGLEKLLKETVGGDNA